LLAEIMPCKRRLAQSGHAREGEAGPALDRGGPTLACRDTHYLDPVARTRACPAASLAQPR